MGDESAKWLSVGVQIPMPLKGSLEELSGSGKVSDYVRAALRTILRSHTLDVLLGEYRKTIKAKWSAYPVYKTSFALDVETNRLAERSAATLEVSKAELIRAALAMHVTYAGNSKGIPGVPHTVKLGMHAHIQIPRFLNEKLYDSSHCSEVLEGIAAGEVATFAHIAALAGSIDHALHHDRLNEWIERRARLGRELLERGATVNHSIRTMSFSATWEYIQEVHFSTPPDTILSWLVTFGLMRAFKAWNNRGDLYSGD